MDIHASCATRGEHGVLLLGPSGVGKSDLVLRLLSLGFELVADDRVVISGRIARPRPDGAGLLEVRGLGILRLPFRADTSLALAVTLRPEVSARVPAPQTWGSLALPMIDVDPRAPSAAMTIALALDCVLGRVDCVAGGLAPCRPSRG